MHFIREGLFLASLADIHKTDQLISQGITHILTVDFHELPDDLKLKLACNGIRIDYVHIVDDPNFNLLRVLDDAIAKLTNRKPMEITVVHCFAGISRSASIIIAYLMKTENISFDKAFNDVKEIKPDICPNPGFQEQLKIFESMGNIVDLKNPLLRRYAIDRLMIHTGSYKNDSSGFEQNAQDIQIANAKCKKCRKILLSSSNVRHFASNKCSSIFLIEPEEWMKITEDCGKEGKFYCPGCYTKLGSFRMKGTQCSCNKHISPSFQIHRNKVDINWSEGVTRQ